MKSSNNRFIILAHLVLAHMFVGGNYVLAQTLNPLLEDVDSIEVIPLRKFDFGTPNPYAEKVSIEESLDNINIIPSNPLVTGSVIVNDDNSAYELMTLSEDDTDYSVGQISYLEDVTPYGGRVYTIPIMSSPLLDFQPQISLQYNSQSGNGVAGYGWTLSGLSSISISNKNLYYNGTVAPARLDDQTAVFSLDGLPLVRNEDSATSEEFPLRTATGHILAKKHMSDNNVAYFTVLYPDGSRAVYGHASNESSVPFYPITLWEDKIGNEIVYNYYYNALDVGYYVSSITSRSKSGNVGSINFNYEGRSDFAEQFIVGEDISAYRLLKNITVKSNYTTLCRYDLTHEYKSGVNLLTSIGCKNSSEEQLRPLKFSYGINSSQNLPQQNDLIAERYMFLCTAFVPDDDTKIQYTRGRYLHNNYQEGIMAYPLFDNYTIIDRKSKGGRYYYKYGSIYDPEQEILLAPTLDFITEVDNSITVDNDFQCINAVDVNGDGVDEIVKINFDGVSEGTSTTNLQITIYEVTPDGILEDNSFNVAVKGIFNDGDVFISPAQRCYMFGDFRGDGETQLLTISFSSNDYYTTGQSYVSLIDLNNPSKISEQSIFILSESEYIDGKIVCVDLDGDSKTELCHLVGDNLNVYNLTASGIRLTKTIPTYDDLLSVNSHFIDINGDGYLDIAKESNSSSLNLNVRQYTGDTFRPKFIELGDRLEGDKCQFIDLNKDGLTDLIHRTGSTIYIYLNENGTYVYANRIVSCLPFSEDCEFIPCNIVDYVKRGAFITVEDFYMTLYDFSQDLSDERLLTKFVNSSGCVTINNYSKMDDPEGAYEYYGASPYNLEDGYSKRLFPLQLLNSTQSYTSDLQQASELFANHTYLYYDACHHAKGLGFKGFNKVKSFDYVNDIITITEYDPERMGVSMGFSKSLFESDSPFESTVNTYDNNFTTYGKSNPRLTQSVSTDYLSGITTTTKIQYDEYDYPTETRVEKSIDSITKSTDIISNTYEHNNTSNKYILGVVTASEVKSNGLDAVTQVYWREKKVVTYDTLCRPVSQNYYVGKGRYSVPNLPNLHVENDALGPLILYTLVKVSETRWDYDEYGNLVSEETAPYESTTFTGTTYSYGQNGRYLISVTDPLGHTLNYSDYNKFGKPTKETDYKGRVTTYTYDDWGNLINVVYPDGSESQSVLAWGGVGMYTLQTITSGSPKSIVHYDVLGREVRSGTKRFNGQWQYVDKVYDERGRLSRESMPFRESDQRYLNTIEYDDYNRITRLIEPSGKQSMWLYNGTSVTSVQNGIGSIKTYDVKGNLVAAQDNGGEITYTLRDDGQPSSVTLNGTVQTTFSYDMSGRRTSIVDPSAGTQTNSVVYNDDGSCVLTHTNPNGTIITYLDRFGRKTKVERPGEYTTDYVYGSDGLLVSETSSNGTSKAYTYDMYDRVLTITETVPDGKWLRRTYSYTIGSNIASVEYQSQNGTFPTETFTYHNGTIVKRNLSNVVLFNLNSENALGQPTSVTTGNVNRTYEYNQYGLPTRRTMGTYMNYTYSFDAATGNLLSRTDCRRNHTEMFGYDALNRLASINDRNIVYDDNGNVLYMSGVGEMQYTNADRPYQITALHMEDNVVPSRDQTVSYTCYSRPSIISEGGRSASFTYNGDGERVKMNISDGATSVLSRYYIGNQYELDVTPNGTIERLYLGGDAYSAPSVFIKNSDGNSGLYHIGRDHMGSITHITTMNGQLVEENNYDPWGRLRNPNTKEIYPLGSEPELMLGRGYTGHEHLTWFGLINMNARLYDPVLGRFLSPDPFVQMPDFSQSFNRYSYCLNNPLVYVDKNGEFWHVPLIIGAVVGAMNGAMIAEYNNISAPMQYIGYMLCGASIGALSGMATWGVSALGGSAILAGVVGGATARSGFAGLSSGWNKDAMLDGLWKGAIAGGVGGTVGGAIGGGWGALLGGSSADLTSQLLDNKGDFSDVNWIRTGVAGLTSLGLYHIAQYWQYNLTDKKIGNLPITYKQFSKMNTLYQRSRFWRREMGMTFSHKGDMTLVPWKDTDKHMINFGRIDKEMPNSVHAHWQQKGAEYLDGFIAVGSTHSPQDLQLGGTSIVIGRTGSSIHYHQFPTCNQISPDPFIRYFLFPWFIL